LEGADVGLRDGAVPVERLGALRPPLADAGRRLAAAVTRLEAVRSPWLVGPVAGRLNRLSRQAAEGRASVGDALVALDVAPRLLGADRPRRWFLAVQTPAEARASGGFIGNFGEISAEDGRVRLERVGRTAELNQGGDPAARALDAPPDYTARYGRFDVDRLWQNVTMSPDFPTVARAIADLYPQSGGRPVDGVVAVDPLGLAALLGALGPVEVPGWPVPITADNADEVLLFEQYVHLDGEARVDFLGRVVAAVWDRLTTTDTSAVALARALGPSVAAKHLLVASTADAGEAAALARLGVSGAMAPVRGDFLGVVTQNAGANKIDWFLRRSVDYSARLDPATGAVRSTVRVTLRNDAPAAGLPGYVIGNDVEPPLPPGSNKLYLSVYTPLQLTRAAVDGAERPVESELERRRHVYSTYVIVPAGGTAVVELELEGRVAPGAGRYRLDLHRQPFLAPDAVTATVGVPDGWRVGRPRARLALDGDRRLETEVRRGG
ncbi:MAG: DUF4012 domain-containing protein, partial [Actinomycetota bacterium]|nr:DUF4012 domain-containing protein [Actinomycetota bacterium]